MGLAKTFKSFLGKHSDELALVGGLLKSVLNTIPIESKEKEKLANAATSLERSAHNIKKSIRDIIEDTAVVKETVKFGDVERAVKNLLPGVIAEAVSVAVASALSERDKKEAANSSDGTAATSQPAKG